VSRGCVVCHVAPTLTVTGSRSCVLDRRLFQSPLLHFCARAASTVAITSGADVPRCIATSISRPSGALATTIGACYLGRWSCILAGGFTLLGLVVPVKNNKRYER
jgi:hypothetical protein